MTSVKTYAEPLLKAWVVQLFISVQHQVLISPAEDQLTFKKHWEKSKVINHSLEMRLVISAQPSWNWSGVCNSDENPGCRSTPVPPRAKGKTAVPSFPGAECCMMDAGVITWLLISWANPGTLLVLPSVGIYEKGASYFFPSCKTAYFWILWPYGEFQTSELLLVRGHQPLFQSWLWGFQGLQQEVGGWAECELVHIWVVSSPQDTAQSPWASLTSK